MAYYSDINNAIKALHYRHGIGDIQQIRQYADGRVELTAKGYGMKPHTRTGRIVSKDGYGAFGKKTIHLYGRQMTVTIVG